jgi:hypothetical protein
MTYKFSQFNVEITNPTVVVVNVNDFINDKTCSIEIQLVTENAIFGVTLDGFTYVNDWSDSEVRAWVEIELQKYEV